MASDPPNSESKDDAEPRTIRIFTTRETANLAAANLRAHDIQCWIEADDCGGALPNLTTAEGVRLLVMASDAEEASALIENEISGAEIPPQSETEERGGAAATIAPRRPWAPGQVFLGVIAGVLLCLLWQWASHSGTHKHYSYDDEGRIDKEWIYHNGILTKVLRDRNHDGEWDEWAYYENGRQSRTEVDNNFDGKPDETWFYSNGVLTRMEKDTNFNGIPDEFCTYENGVIKTLDFRPNGAKFPTKRSFYQNYVLTEVYQKPDSNGAFTEAVRYDPFENPIRTNKLQ